MMERIRKKNECVNKLIFVLAFSTNLYTNIPCGIIPASTSQIMAEFGLHKIQMGIIGSLVYVGVVSGSIFSMGVFNKFKSKHMIVTFIVLDVVFLILFKFSYHYSLVCLARFGAGFFKIFLIIYFPVWIDLYGKTNKSIWLTFLQIAVPIGIFIGYSIGTLLGMYKYSWKYGFLLASICLIINAFIFMLIPSCYLEINTLIISREKNQNNLNLLEESQNSVTPTEQVYRYQSKSYLQNMKYLLRRKLFVCCSLALSSMFFVVTCIQFWIKDYFVNIYGISTKQVYLMYGIVTLTGPILGVIIGGSILSRFGGYTHPNAIKICLIYSIFASSCGIPIPFIENYKICVLLLWLLLFFGGCCIPSLMGIMISSVPKYLRSFANSNAQTFQNIFGYAPGPFLYGIICDLTGGEKSKYGMMFAMCWTLWALLSLYFACLLKDNQLRSRAQKQKDTHHLIEPYSEYENFDIEFYNHGEVKKQSCESNEQSPLNNNQQIGQTSESLAQMFGGYNSNLLRSDLNRMQINTLKFHKTSQ